MSVAAAVLARGAAASATRRRLPPGALAARRCSTHSRRDAAAARVESRRPQVANARLIAEIEAKSGATVFTRWLSLPDRVFRKGVHGDSQSLRWLRAKTTDPIYDFRRWRRLQNPWRYANNFAKPMEWLKSDVVRRLIVPDLPLVFMNSSLLGAYNAYLAEPGSPVFLPTEPFMLTALAIGLLVTFRTQTSYSRYSEACRVWSAVRSNSRELCARIYANVPTPRSQLAKHPEVLKKRDMGAKLAQTFCHALKFYVTIDGCSIDYSRDLTIDVSDTEIMARKREHFRDELELIWNFDDQEERAVAERLLQEDVHCWPVQVCQEISHLVATEYVAPNRGGMGAPNAEGINALVTALQHSVAQCENILHTPIYTPYTVFTGRVIYGWVHTLPLVFAGVVSPLATPLLSVASAFLFLGIDDIGQRVEQPFMILPLWDFCAVIDRDCAQIFKNARTLG